MKQVRRNFSDVLRLLALTALLGASAAHANEYGDIAQLLRTEVPRWGRIVKDSGASLD